MRVRNKPWAQDFINSHSDYVVTSPELYKGKWQERFENSQPIHIEVGSGKGRFIVEMAKAHPENNYISIEMDKNVLAAILEKQVEEKLPNLQILHVNGAMLTEYFAEGEVSLVYLNFSDPWPKTRHAKRRLTYKTFLATYEKILIPNGEIHFKTDNRGLFEYSLVSFSQYGVLLQQVWLDLHVSGFEGNIMTEYEEKFSMKGQPIYRVEARFVAENS